LVEPLPTPHASDLSALIGNESVQLFADRAQAVKPDFQLTTGNAAFVAKLCQQLEGVPLAIELAAARSNLFGLSQLRERLRKRETLTRARVRNPAHPYASLPAAVEWSYNLLLPELQRFFAQLAVFRGGLTAEAAEAVCEEPLAIDYLSELAECSLLQRRDTPLGVRFEMLEFISEYAADRLRPSSELHAVRQRHIDFFRRMGDDWIALRPPNKEWLDRVESELANISVAQDSCDSGENGVEDGLWLAARFAEFFLFRGDISVGLRLMERALQRDRNCTASNVRAGALFIAAAFSQQMGNHQNAIRFYDESISIYAVLGDRMGMAGVMNDRANSERLYGDFTSARLHYEEALALNRELGNRTWMCINLLNISGTAGCVGEFDRSFALGEEALTLSRELGARASEANILDLLGLTRLKMGDPTSGRRYLEESLRIHHQQGTSAIQTLSILAYVEAMLCEFDAARSRLISCFRQIHERGLHIATSLFDYASLFIIAVSEHTGEGKLDRKAGLSATMLLGVSDALRESQGTVICKHYEPDLGRARAKLREVLGEQSFRITWADGHSTKLHQAIARAIADLEMITSKAVILK
jgi:tetratricopeptide (TPR) repeat protein